VLALREAIASFFVKIYKQIYKYIHTCIIFVALILKKFKQNEYGCCSSREMPKKSSLSGTKVVPNRGNQPEELEFGSRN
jgi:hypothetical protein